LKKGNKLDREIAHNLRYFKDFALVQRKGMTENATPLNES